MNIREVALELTALISHELETKTPKDIIELYKKCYKGVMEAEKNDLLEDFTDSI